MGDARLTFAKEPDGVYDLIIVDAYSSDAIPIHLATEEAMEIYKDKLAPQGAVVMHVSNRHLELASVVVGIADANDLKSWVYSEDSDRDNEYIFATAVVVSRARGGRRRQARLVGQMGADRGRGPPAGLDRRLFQRARRGVAAVAGRRAVGGGGNWLMAGGIATTSSPAPVARCHAKPASETSLAETSSRLLRAAFSNTHH